MLLNNKNLKIVLMLSVAPFILGSDACERSYEFAANATTPTVTPTATETPTETTTATETVTVTPSVTATVTPTPTTSSATILDPENVGSAILNSLLDLNKKSSTKSRSGTSAVTENKNDKGGNWLGKYDDQEVPGVSLDSDNDGYIDLYEIDSGTDSQDASSTPLPPTSRLINRFSNIDDDLDGLSNEKEKELGTDPLSSDSDSDGALDGAEVLSGTDPNSSKSTPNDRDGDGLSNEFEAENGTDSNTNDTDRDNLRDDIELAIGSSPLDNDTDKDGILDGKEVELGADPLIQN